jgi:hypothetical protein
MKEVGHLPFWVERPPGSSRGLDPLGLQAHADACTTGLTVPDHEAPESSDRQRLTAAMIVSSVIIRAEARHQAQRASMM